MIRRLRVVSALLVIVAMSLSVGEGLGAATCAPMEPGARVEAPESGESLPVDCAPSHQDDSDADGGCPFAGIATFSGCVSAAAESPTIENNPTPPSSPRISIENPSRSDLLLARSLFRPPRA